MPPIDSHEAVDCGHVEVLGPRERLPVGRPHPEPGGRELRVHFGDDFGNLGVSVYTGTWASFGHRDQYRL